MFVKQFPSLENRRRPARWEVAVERPVYDLTIFKLHCGKLTLKIYTKGERVLRIEAVAHNIQELNCGRSLEHFPELVCRLKAMLERFADALSYIDQCSSLMICWSVSRSPHASARPSSVASISTRRACATSLKHSSPCPPRPTASPPPTSPLGCAFSANKARFRTAPAMRPTISKNSAANTSFSGSPALAGTTHSRPAFAQWPPSWCFATKPSNPCSLPLNRSAQPAARTTRDPSTPTTMPYRSYAVGSKTLVSRRRHTEPRKRPCNTLPLFLLRSGPAAGETVPLC